MKNLIVRTISGIVFTALVVGAVLWCDESYTGLMMLVIICMMSEFMKMSMAKKLRWLQYAAIFTGVFFWLLVKWTFSIGLPIKYVGLAALPLLGIMAGSLYLKDRRDFSLVTGLYAALLYIAVPLSFANVLLFNDGQYDGMLLLCFFIIIWSSDIGAYLLGSTLGQKFGARLFPSVSPKKSWVGLFGGVLMSLGVAVGLYFLGWLGLPLVHCIVLAVIICLSGVYGDLVESGWKRHFGLKDSGRCIPGHGGMLDRFDSSLFAIPCGAIYLMLCGLI